MLMTRRTASCNAIGGSSGCKNSRLAWARRADHAQYLDHWLSVTKTDKQVDLYCRVESSLFQAP
jgi:hypothetical protein